MSALQTWIAGPQLVGLVFLLVGTLMHFFPPKHINSFYGYRTPSSKRNQQTWDEANRYAAIYMMKMGVVVLAAGLLFTVFLKEFNGPLKVKQAFHAFSFIFSGILPAILLIVATERHLSKTFGDN